MVNVVCLWTYQAPAKSYTPPLCHRNHGNQRRQVSFATVKGREGFPPTAYGLKQTTQPTGSRLHFANRSPCLSFSFSLSGDVSDSVPLPP